MKESKKFKKLLKARNNIKDASHKLQNASRYDADTTVGLNAEQVEERIHDDLTNRKPINRSKSIPKIVFDNFFNFCNTITIALVILLIVIGAGSYAVSSCIIFISIGIGIAQEIKAKRTVEKLSMVVDSVCDILRDGEWKELSTRELVLDDIFRLKAGTQVPVDCIVKNGFVEIDESIITGESIPVKKNTGDSILAGSHVVGGESVVRAEKVGKDCYIENIARVARRVNKPYSNIFTNLNRIIIGITCLLVPLSILLFISNFFVAKESVNQTIINVSSAAIAMIPVGMFLLTSTALAVSVIKLSKNNTLAQDLYSIEMLAMVDTLLLDKTGTITDGNLEVIEIKEIAESYYSIDDIVSSIIKNTNDKNSTALALTKKYQGENDITPEKVIPFSSKRKYSGIMTDKGSYILGAPDFISYGLEEEDEYVTKQSMMGRRSLLLVHFDGDIEEFDKTKSKPIAIFVLEDSLRADVESTLNWFAENNVDIKIVSGDNPITVSQIAMKSGVINANKYLNCSEITEEELKNKSIETTVFGRVNPEQKQILVKDLHSKGRIVGMIGDGVNDVQALKDADCSISFASANEAARNVSRIVLMDSNFKTMPKIVEEGRSVIGNVEKVSSLYIMKNLFIMFFTLVFAISGFITKNAEYPFDTKKILLIEFFVIGVPTFLIALQPNRRRVEGDFLKNVITSSIPAALSLIAGVGVIFLTFIFRTFDYVDASILSNYQNSLLAIALTLAGFSALFIICLPLDKFRIAVIAVMMVLSAVGICLDYYVVTPIMGDNNFLNIIPPIGIDYLYLLLSVVVAALVNVLTRKLISTIFKKKIKV
jgi:cation-transporting ATPase E